MNMAANIRGDGASALPAVVPTGEVVLEVGGQPLRFYVAEDGRLWATAADVGAFLGYSEGRKLLTLWTRYIDELGDETTPRLAVRTTTNRPGKTQLRHARAFSPRGVERLALLSSTPRGRALRSAIISRGVTAPTPPAPVRLTEPEAVEAIKGVVDDALEQVDAIRKAAPKSSDALGLALDVRNALRECRDVLRVHAGQVEVGRAGWALMARDLVRAKKSNELVDSEAENGWARLLGAAEGKRA
jgi:hypothetical protein